MPTTVKASAVSRPAAGSIEVESTVTSTGPMTKSSSSSTDSMAYAVSSRRPGPSNADHRARTCDPRGGQQTPVGTAAANSVQCGA